MQCQPAGYLVKCYLTNHPLCKSCGLSDTAFDCFRDWAHCLPRCKELSEALVCLSKHITAQRNSVMLIQHRVSHEAVPLEQTGWQVDVAGAWTVTQSLNLLGHHCPLGLMHTGSFFSLTSKNIHFKVSYNKWDSLLSLSLCVSVSSPTHKIVKYSMLYVNVTFAKGTL